jgi:hypothetical protein
MNRQHITSNYPKITNNYNIMNNNCGMMPVIAINITPRSMSSATTTTESRNKRVYSQDKPDNHPHKHRDSTTQKSHQHKLPNPSNPNPSNLYICITCGTFSTQVTSCCQNKVIKITSIFSGNGLECENFKINHLFSKSNMKALIQVPLTMECLSEVVNNQQRIKLYSLKSYSVTNTAQTDNNNFGRSAMIYEVPITECIYILIPNHLPRLYVPKYGVIQLDARNSLILPTREHATINNDTKKIVV